MIVVEFHAVGTDVLGDSTRFSCNDVGLSDVVQKRRLSVVNVAHYRYNGRSRNEVDLIFLLDCELVFHLFVDKNYVKPKFVGDDG